MDQSAINTRSKEEVLILKPTRGWGRLNLGELWKYRELTYFLTWRDLKVRYKQTVLGASWAILQPFLSMVVFSVFFGSLLNVPSEGVPYPVFSYTALLPWGVFAKALNDAGRSLVTNRSMITKIYFPRMVIPVASVISGLVDFAIAFIVLLGMMWYFHIPPTVNIWTLPLFLLLALLTALGIGLWLSALNVLYRDIGYIIPFLTQLWFYLTPIVYPASQVPEHWRNIYALNPMVGVVEGFRWALLDTATAPGPMVVVSSIVALLMLLSGMFYFRRMERTFADMV
ncbi:MAG: ABC transporter permease [Chloroflexota bacterium]|nr:MAG: ABC transporter permease [Chloroflexota bacterium]